MRESGAIEVYRALLVERAADLARSGDYAEAEQLLAKVTALDNESPTVLDLLARIRAQQGQYHEAERFWKEAARLDPDNAEYRAGLASVRAVQERPYLAIPWLPIGVGILTVSVLGLVGASLLSGKGNSPDPGSMVTTTHAALPTPQASAILVKPVFQSPKLALTVPGVVLSTEDDAVIAKFEGGLFDSRIRLLPAARQTLTQLAQQLKTQDSRLRIEVVGHTNELPVHHRSPFADNVGLGFQRAVVVAQALRTLAGSQDHRFIISSDGEANPPFQHDSLESQMRNRTVTLRMSRLSQS